MNINEEAQHNFLYRIIKSEFNVNPDHDVSMAPCIQSLALQS